MSNKTSIRKNINNASRMLKYGFKVAPFEVSLLFFMTILSELSPIILGYFLKLIIDRLSGAEIIFTLVLSPFLAYLTFKAFDSIFDVLRESVVEYFLRWKIQDKIWIDYHSKLFDVDIASFEDPETFNVMMKANNSMTWRPYNLIQSTPYFIGALISLISSILITISFGIWIPLIIIITTLPTLIVGLKFGLANWSVFESGAESNKKLYYLSGLVINPNYMPELRIFKVRDKIIGNIKNIQQEFFIKNKSIILKFGAGKVSAILIQILGFLIVIIPQLQKAVSGEISPGTFSFILTTLFAFAGSIGLFFAGLSAIREESLHVGYFFEVLGIEKKVRTQPHAMIPLAATKAPRVEFKNVGFKYKEADKYVLKDVSFVIEPGENVALVGENGAGKSTIIKLLVRFYDVTEGEILIDGVNIKDIDLNWWYDKVGTLFQQFIQYNFTVKESISLQSENIDIERVKQAAKLAGADKFIEAFENQYDQMLGVNYEEGKGLSGGQWQKMALARAFYRMPSLLVLDEPTSAIDAQAEYEIFKNINEIYKDDKSLLIVSHRFSTVRNAEKIIVLDDGQIAEQGTHDELLGKDGLYARMFKAQAEGYK